jgi:hypothetical protein
LPVLVSTRTESFSCPSAGHHPTLTNELLSFEVAKLLPQFALFVGVAVAREIRYCNGAEFANLGHHFPLC